MSVTIDSAGRLVVPKAIREEAELRPDLPLTIKCRDRHIEIEPAAQPVTRAKKGRVAVALATNVASLSAEAVRRTQQHLRGRRA
jgi:AbrB family looped-hinge helix DNA binding protein